MGRKPKQPSGRSPELTPLELTIMQILWERGNATAAEVGDALRERRPLADTTIHTVLANLRKKGYLEPIPTVERALRFAPCIPQEQVAGRWLRGLMRDFFGGSPRRLMAHLIQQDNVDEMELEEIRKLLESSSRKGGQPQ
jgi:BlaI family penicillinase repressor